MAACEDGGRAGGAGRSAESNDEFLRLRAAGQMYLAARRHELAPASRRHIGSDLGLAVRYIGPDVLVRSLRRRHVESWLSSMEVSPATLRGRLSVLRNFCRWCVGRGFLKADPTLGVKGPRQPVAMPRELDAGAVVKAFLSAPDPRAELVLSLGVQEGLRVGEIARLRREDVDVDGLVLLVNGKGSKQRWLPLSAYSLELLLEYCRQVPGRTGPVIRSSVHPARGLSGNYLSKLVVGWMYDAGVKSHAYDGVSAHALRHTMAGVMLDEGADIREVQAALGHSSLGPTYVYTRRRHGASQLRSVMGRRDYRSGG